MPVINSNDLFFNHLGHRYYFKDVDDDDDDEYGDYDYD
jgi:hypothetical protein